MLEGVAGVLHRAAWALLANRGSVFRARNLSAVRSPVCLPSGGDCGNPAGRAAGVGGSQPNTRLTPGHYRQRQQGSGLRGASDLAQARAAAQTANANYRNAELNAGALKLHRPQQLLL